VASQSLPVCGALMTGAQKAMSVECWNQGALAKTPETSLPGRDTLDKTCGVA
jgi:hypothetical protein